MAERKFSIPRKNLRISIILLMITVMFTLSGCATQSSVLQLLGYPTTTTPVQNPTDGTSGR